MRWTAWPLPKRGAMSAGRVLAFVFMAPSLADFGAACSHGRHAGPRADIQTFADKHNTVDQEEAGTFP
jgi:hypothetical protein